MTKEELEKEAEEYAERKLKEYISTYLDCTPSQFEKYLCNEYLSIIEPREKRIAELELKIKHLTEHLEPQTMTALFKQVAEEVKQEQRLNELEKENAELKILVSSILYEINALWDISEMNEDVRKHAERIYSEVEK